MSKLVILRRCATLEEALIVRSLLQDGGFYAHIGEYHISHMQWDAIAAFGGVTVWVRHPRLLEAGTYLMEMRASADQRLKSELGDYDSTPLKLRWGRAWSMVFIQMGGGALIWSFLAFLLALSPIDWWQMAHDSAPFRNYYPPDFSQGPSGISNNIPRPEGILFILLVALLVIWDMISTRDQIRLNNGANGEEENAPPRPL